jgi:hypothetical protein
MAVSQQKTLRMIAMGLAKRPAYLLIFGLGVIGGGVAGTFSLLTEGGDLSFFIIGCFFTYLIISVMIALKVESNVKPEGNSVIPDAEAQKEFMAGPDASRLSGTWELNWKWEAGEDLDQVTLTISGATVFGTSFDDENNRTYWFIGRIDEDGDMPALFWGRDGNGPVGCAFMKREGHSRFVGTWKGVDKNDEDGHCHVTLEKKG